MRIGLAALRLAQHNPQEAIAALAPFLDGSAPGPWQGWLAQAFLLEAIARDAIGDEDAAGQALERALDLAEPDGVLTIFLLHPAPGLLQRQAWQRTAHAGLIADSLSLLAGRTLAPPPAGPPPPLEALSDSEVRVACVRLPWSSAGSCPRASTGRNHAGQSRPRPRPGPASRRAVR
jgi:LuxR family transcriptional regulator, maltose regulon positive regulatory protein